MSSTVETRFDIVYSPLDVTENTVLPRSDELEGRHDFWNQPQLPPSDCPEGLLLLWPIFGPLNNITVVDSTATPDEVFQTRQPFVIENPDGSKTFHPVASLPATYPLLSQITASAGIFDEFGPISERMAEQHDLDWDGMPEAERAGVTKFYCRDERCKDQPYLYMVKEPGLFIDARDKPYVTLGEAVCAIH